MHRALLFERICLAPFSTLGLLIIRIVAFWLEVPALDGTRWNKLSILGDSLPNELVAEGEEWGLIATVAHPLRLRAIH